MVTCENLHSLISNSSLLVFDVMSLFLGARVSKYRENMINLENVLLVKFSRDTVVDPKGIEHYMLTCRVRQNTWSVEL